MQTDATELRALVMMGSMMHEGGIMSMVWKIWCVQGRMLGGHRDGKQKVDEVYGGDAEACYSEVLSQAWSTRVSLDCL